MPPLDTSKSDRTSGNWTTRGTFGTLLPCRSNCGVVIGLCGWVIDLREGWGRALGDLLLRSRHVSLLGVCRRKEHGRCCCHGSGSRWVVALEVMGAGSWS